MNINDHVTGQGLYSNMERMHHETQQIQLSTFQNINDNIKIMFSNIEKMYHKIERLGERHDGWTQTWRDWKRNNARPASDHEQYPKQKEPLSTLRRDTNKITHQSPKITIDYNHQTPDNQNRDSGIKGHIPGKKQNLPGQHEKSQQPKEKEVNCRKPQILPESTQKTPDEEAIPEPMPKENKPMPGNSANPSPDKFQNPTENTPGAEACWNAENTGPNKSQNKAAILPDPEVNSPNSTS